MGDCSRLLVTVCARGGSKGIPGKNIRLINGKPLLEYTVINARKFAESHGCDIMLSTDSNEIREVGRQLGLDASYKRPAELANDVIGKPEAIRDAMLWYEQKNDCKIDMVVDLDVTSPIRTLYDIDRCLEMMKEDKDALTCFSVSPAGRNPYFNMVEEKPDGYCKVILGGHYTSRQTAPKVYDINGSIYIYRRESLMRETPKAVTERSLIYIMNHICFDLDEPEDFDYMEFLMTTGRLDRYFK